MAKITAIPKSGQLREDSPATLLLGRMFRFPSSQQLVKTLLRPVLHGALVCSNDPTKTDSTHALMDSANALMENIFTCSSKFPSVIKLLLSALRERMIESGMSQSEASRLTFAMLLFRCVIPPMRQPVAYGLSKIDPSDEVVSYVKEVAALLLALTRDFDAPPRSVQELAFVGNHWPKIPHFIDQLLSNIDEATIDRMQLRDDIVNWAVPLSVAGRSQSLPSNSSSSMSEPVPIQRTQSASFYSFDSLFFLTKSAMEKSFDHAKSLVCDRLGSPKKVKTNRNDANFTVSYTAKVKAPMKTVHRALEGRHSAYWAKIFSRFEDAPLMKRIDNEHLVCLMLFRLHKLGVREYLNNCVSKCDDDEAFVYWESFSDPVQKLETKADMKALPGESTCFYLCPASDSECNVVLAVKASNSVKGLHSSIAHAVKTDITDLYNYFQQDQ